MPQPSVSDVFEAVESGRASAGVVPVENSAEGGVGVTLDRFMESDLKICGELMSPISHVLMSQKNDERKVKVVYSHPQGLAQCRRWLANHLPQAEMVETPSTAAAAEKAATDPFGAAVGSRLAAQAQGLKILATDIQDNPHNTTRFWVLGDSDCPPTGTDKTSLMFVVSHRPGSLYQALGHLASRGLNLTRIESRPTKQRPWEYAFFVDLAGHREDPAMAQALEEIKDDVLWLKILGSYPEALSGKDCAGVGGE
jgi:chorismate mutase/prephenate dehydratase